MFICVYLKTADHSRLPPLCFGRVVQWSGFLPYTQTITVQVSACLLYARVAEWLECFPYKKEYVSPSLTAGINTHLG